MMGELGFPVSAAAVARRYRDLLDAYVLDRADAADAAAEAAELGIAVSVAHTLMTTIEEREALARHVLATADALAEPAA
jgi:LPPG:FO 2-phospho-L-lactate transferase